MRSCATLLRNNRGQIQLNIGQQCLLRNKARHFVIVQLNIFFIGTCNYKNNAPKSGFKINVFSLCCKCEKSGNVDQEKMTETVVAS